MEVAAGNSGIGEWFQIIVVYSVGTVLAGLTVDESQGPDAKRGR